MRLARPTVAVLLSLVLTNSSWAVRALDPKQYPPNAGQCRVHGFSAARIQAAGGLRPLIIGTATGAKTVAVIPVRFPSADTTLTTKPNLNTSGSGGQNLIQSCANIDTYFSQMQTYFQEVSYNKIPSITFKFFGDSTASVNGDTSACVAGSHVMPHPMEYYGCGDESRGCSGVTTPTPGSVSANGNYLIKDALLAARAAHANTPTARTSGGNFDAVIVMHAGNGNETTGSSNSTTLGAGDIWSIFYSQDSIITAGGGGFTEGDVVPETEASGITSPLGVICHEFGHELGLPDLYNTGSQGGTSVVGDWDLMDSGPYVGNGANPSHFGVWGKYYLGWITPTSITTRSSPLLNYIENVGANAVKLPVQNGGSQEYFLVEYRSRTSGATYDRNIPGDGLLIWHVDDELTAARGLYVTDQSLANTVNTGTPHFGVTIAAANGIAISGGGRGTSGNAYSGGTFASPRTDNFSGQASGITLANVAFSGGHAEFDVVNLAVTSTQSITKVVNYPNPAGKGYRHTKGEGYTTFQFQLTRPGSDMQLNLYTLSGDLVRKFSTSDINLNVDRSLDRKWVYEVDWDLKNGDGELVAPGVYLVLVRVDGLTKTHKTVIIR